MVKTLNYQERIDTACKAIRAETDAAPSVGLILGSGLGDFCDGLENRLEIPFSRIPGLPTPTVEGHQGSFVFGTFDGALPLSGAGFTTTRDTPRETLPSRSVLWRS